MKKLILLILLIPSLLFAGPLQQMHKAVIGAGSTVAGGCTGDGEIGFDASLSGYPATVSDTFYYTEYTASAGEVSYIHIYLGYLNGYSANIAVYNTSGVKQFEHYISSVSGANEAWVDLALSSAECLTATDYLIGITHTRATGARVFRGSISGKQIRSIAMSCDSSLENFTPGNSALLEDDIGIGIVVDNNATN